MALPSCLSLKSSSNGKYLRYRYEKDQTHGLLRFDGDKFVEVAAQFEVEKSRTWSGLVHIKSRFNNRYLVRWSPDNEYITASANASDENKSNWTCTLFEPITNDANSKEPKTKNNILLRHVQLGNYVFSPEHPGSLYDSCLVASDDEHESNQEVFTTVDWESESSKLPRRVLFKADNDKFLGMSRDASGEKYLTFTFEDPMRQLNKVEFELVPTPEGILYIKLAHNRKFGYWKTTAGGLVVAHADDPLSLGSKNTAAMFRLIELDNEIGQDKVYAIQHINTFCFCTRLGNGSDEYENYLSVTAKSIDEPAQLKMISLDNYGLDQEHQEGNKFNNVGDCEDQVIEHIDLGDCEDQVTKGNNLKRTVHHTVESTIATYSRELKRPRSE